MECFNPESLWAPHHDQYGRIYWRHRITSDIRWDNPMLVGRQGFVNPPQPFAPAFGQHQQVRLPNMWHPPFGQPGGAYLPVAEPIPARMDQPLGLRLGVHPNIVQPVSVYPSQEVFAGAWEEHFDKFRKRKYWYNTVTKETTWEDPKKKGEKPPPPPTSPPPPEFEKREQDLWSKVDDGRGGKIWFNEKTKETQYGVPDCRKKYGAGATVGASLLPWC